MDILFTQWFWFILAVVWIILDVILGANFFLLYLGILAGLVGGLVSLFPGMPWHFQALIFSIGAIISISWWSFYIRKNPPKSSHPTLNRRSEQYVGRIFSLSEAIVNGRGKIEIDGTSWRVEGPELPLGTKVQVESADGLMLKIKKIELPE